MLAKFGAGTENDVGCSSMCVKWGLLLVGLQEEWAESIQALLHEGANIFPSNTCKLLQCVRLKDAPGRLNSGSALFKMPLSPLRTGLHYLFKWTLHQLSVPLSL